MKITETKIPDVLIFLPNLHEDGRGYFYENFRSSWIPGFDFVQENQSFSSKNTLRGLHYQFEKPQGKLIRVIDGEIFDVVVDLRKREPTFGTWMGKKLNGDEKEMLWIPPGFAHGFFVSSETALVSYICTEYYDQKSERVISWDDEDLSIKWPLIGNIPNVSNKDNRGISFKEAPYF